MAKAVAAMPEKYRIDYPWDEWLDGRPWELVPGEDFKCTPASFRMLAALNAKHRGLKLVSRTLARKFYIQAIKREPTE